MIKRGTIQFVGWLLVALITAAITQLAAHAQSYPEKTIRIVSPFTPGGGTDLMGRLIGQQFTKNWGQQVIVENRPGANGQTRAVNRDPLAG